jgi:hypothetical protein
MYEKTYVIGDTVTDFIKVYNFYSNKYFIKYGLNKTRIFISVSGFSQTQQTRLASLNSCVGCRNMIGTVQPSESLVFLTNKHHTAQNQGDRPVGHLSVGGTTISPHDSITEF